MQYELINIGEIRFGPSFHQLKIEGIILPNRIFGNEINITENEQYVILQEWLSTDYSEGPITRPFIIDKAKKKYIFISEGKKGFSSNFILNDTILYYTQRNYGTGINRNFECDLSKLTFIDLEI